MNYQDYAGFSNVPAGYGRERNDIYDRGSGLNQINKNNMTMQDIRRTPFLFLQDHENNYGVIAERELDGLKGDSELSRLFFSKENIRRIQKAIKKAVYQKSNGEYKLDSDQDENDVIIVMQKVYAERAKVLPGQNVRQVKRLNEYVVDEVIDEILSSIKMNYKYLKEINEPLQPLPRPMNMSHKKRSLKSVMTSFGI
ncbi:MAG: hypothetical protein Barrevirus20_3 [Barrevirus sp.]|uniref:Minor capsid protein P8 central region domain-containing protein n=1 Tax=Barrevirus sp. TaxID=2487763 RepID=A0A3G4ZQS2_9VIRU|nr:MAG: hypothetical protein Barrevirus20_3 [Barrevirus sp.]